MTIERVYASGWGVGEKLTSAQQNAIDINTAAALDKRAGYGDLLASVVQATGPGRIISTVQTGPDASTTFHPWGGNSIVRVPTLTAARTYTLGHSGATGGDRMLFYIEGTGHTASGYVDIANNVGTGLFRLGMVNHSSPNEFAEGREAEFLFNGTGWQLMRGAGPGLRQIEFLTSAVWVCPPGVYNVVGYGWGGGGGGGAGGRSANSTADGAVGGGGGGGSVSAKIPIPVVPMREYRIDIGAGGSGGHYTIPNVNGVNVGDPGSDGGDTTVTDLSTGQVVARWPGGGGGFVATRSTATTIFNFARGGANMHLPISVATMIRGNTSGYPVSIGSGGGPWMGWFGPGWGGNAVTPNTPTAMRMSFGMGSHEGYTGGAPGAFGSGLTGYVNWACGGGGGGGGAGPGGDGVTGGAGGGWATGTGQFGAAPTADAGANSGAGGGGGGAGGASDGTGGDGASGSAGGSGKLTFWIVK